MENWEAKAEVHAGDPKGDPAEPSPGTARPPPATDGTGEGLPMSPHRSGGKSKAEAPKRRAETPAPGAKNQVVRKTAETVRPKN